MKRFRTFLIAVLCLWGAGAHAQNIPLSALPSRPTPSTNDLVGVQPTGYLGLEATTAGGIANYTLQRDANSWAQSYSYGADSNTPAVILGADNGNPAGYFGARTKGSVPGNAPAGIIAFGFADTVIPGFNGTWAIYDECRRYPTVTYACVTNEVDFTDFDGTAVALDPYIEEYAQGNQVTGLFLQAGGGCTNAAPCYDPATQTNHLTASTASAAIGIGNNGAQTAVGINFGYNALLGNDGKTANDFGIALRLARGDGFEEDYCNNTSSYPSNCGAYNGGVFEIFEVDNPADVIKAHWSDTGFFLTNANNQTIFGVNNITTSFNDGVVLSGGSTGSPTVIVSAQGTDSNVNIALYAKGTGIVQTNAPIVTVTYTVATLPSSPGEGARAFITDDNSACTFLGAISGGVTTHCPVIYVSGAWKAG